MNKLFVAQIRCPLARAIDDDLAGGWYGFGTCRTAATCSSVSVDRW